MAAPDDTSTTSGRHDHGVLARRSLQLGLALAGSIMLCAHDASAQSSVTTLISRAYGRVVTEAGTPVAAAGVHTSNDASACVTPDGSPAAYIAGFANQPAETSATGEYRLELVGQSSRPGCVVLYVDPPAGQGLDVAVVPLPNVRFKDRRSPDSMRVDIVVPALAPAEPRPGTRRFLAVSAGATHSCAIAADSTAWCWGANDAGQLGAVTTGRCQDGGRPVACSREPVAVGGGLRAAQVSAGDRYTCALDGAGRAFCWGAGRRGVLGTGTTADRPRPERVATKVRFREVQAGGSLTCALTLDGQVACWGAAPLWTPTPAVVPGGHRFRRLAVGVSHACASHEQGAYCWGEGSLGAFGNGVAERMVSRIPLPVAPRGADLVSEGLWYLQLSAGADFTCGLNGWSAEYTLPPDDIDSGSAWCWGSNAERQVFGGFGAWGSNPVLHPDAMRCRVGSRPASCAIVPRYDYRIGLTSIDAGWQHVCAVGLLTQAGDCWGLDVNGVRGAGHPVHRYVGLVSRVEGRLRWSMISAGQAHSCGLTTQERIFCWGDNTLGQLGDGTAATRWRPVRVVGSR